MAEIKKYLLLFTMIQVLIILYMTGSVDYFSFKYSKNSDKIDSKTKDGSRTFTRKIVKDVKIDLKGFPDVFDLRKDLYFMTNNSREDLINVPNNITNDRCNNMSGLKNNESLPWQLSTAFMVTKEELDMPIAFSILVYTDFKMLELLLDSMFKPQNIYCIHVDAKCSQFYKDSVYKLARCYENVFIAKKLYNVTWGKFSIVDAEMSCMEDLVARSGTWKYFINLTGQEFPLRTNYELARILSGLGGRNEVFCRPVNISGRLDGLIRPTPGIKLYKGPTHVALTRGFVEFLLYDKLAKSVLNWLKFLPIPDEHVFPTLHCNKQIKAPGSVNDTTSSKNNSRKIKIRFKLWMYGNQFRNTSSLIKRNLIIFNSGHFPLLAKSEMLFANKFHITKYPDVVYMLKKMLQQRSYLEYAGYLDFNASLYKKTVFIPTGVVNITVENGTFVREKERLNVF